MHTLFEFILNEENQLPSMTKSKNYYKKWVKGIITSLSQKFQYENGTNYNLLFTVYR